MQVLWLYGAGIVAVVGLVYLYAYLTMERTGPAHSSRRRTPIERARGMIPRRPGRKPLSRRQQARRQARRDEWAARMSRLRGLLRRRPRPPKPISAPAPLVTSEPPAGKEKDVPAAPEATDPGGFPLLEEPGEDWAATLRLQLRKDEDLERDPDRHLQRSWPEGDSTGTFQREMLARMIKDGQMPPAPADRTGEWPARTEQAGDPDAFMGRKPAQDPEDGGDSS